MKKLTRKQFDEKFARALVLQEEIEKRKNELEEIKGLVSGYFKLAKSEGEEIQGVEFMAVKTPVNRGQNTFDAVAMRKALTAELKDTITPLVATVNKENLKLAKKTKTITEEFLAKYRINQWTCTVTFKRKEKSSQNIAKKAKKVAAVPVIPEGLVETANEQVAK